LGFFKSRIEKQAERDKQINEQIEKIEDIVREKENDCVIIKQVIKNLQNSKEQIIGLIYTIKEGNENDVLEESNENDVSKQSNENDVPKQSNENDVPKQTNENDVSNQSNEFNEKNQDPTSVTAGTKRNNKRTKRRTKRKLKKTNQKRKTNKKSKRSLRHRSSRK